MIKDIFNGMAKAFFADAFANMIDDQEGIGFPGGSDIMDFLPEEIDPEALRSAQELYSKMEPQFTDEFLATIEHVVWEDFGHYCAMQAMGHGVGLHDFYYDYDLDEDTMPEVPYVESCMLAYGYHGLCPTIVIKYNKEGFAWVIVEEVEEPVLICSMCAEKNLDEYLDPINIQEFVRTPHDDDTCWCFGCDAVANEKPIKSIRIL